MDSITGAGAYPFVELGFMPLALSTHPTPDRNTDLKTLDSGCFYPPNDYTKWAELIRTWATHANERYSNVGASWLWELWNEPDIGYWKGTFDEYAKLYDYTESALHEVIPNAPLGGPAVAGPASGFLKAISSALRDRHHAVTGNIGTRLDHVTFHAKGDVPVVEPCTDEPRQPTAASPRRLPRGGGGPPVQADTDLRYRGRPRRLRGMLGEQRTR